MWWFIGGLILGGGIGFIGSVYWLIRHPNTDWECSLNERDWTVSEMNGIKFERPQTVWSALAEVNRRAS